ncbi:GNAT family N-acetyltransferase [Methanosarcina mazei]|nr:GNAT family N-acetyltransferase [Methanosarcina mazei]
MDKKDIITRYKMYDNWDVFVAEEGGKVAGWIGLTLKTTPEQKEKYVYITEVMVDPAFQRTGIATRLIKEAERRRRKWRRLMLTVIYTSQTKPPGSYLRRWDILK